MGERERPVRKTPPRAVSGQFESTDVIDAEINSVSVERKPEGERLLDEALSAVRDYVAIGDAESVAMTLYAAATHAAPSFRAFGRLLFNAETHECGKTVAMMTTVHLSANPEDCDGTSYAIQSMLAEYANAPEKGRPTLYLDEINQVFGKSGLNGSSNPVANILRKGYKSDARAKWSVNRVSEEYSTYTPFIVAGNGNSVPVDIRSRAIVIQCVRGIPRFELEDYGSEDRLKRIGRSLGREVPRHRGALEEFRVPRNEIPGMSARKAQIWHPLMAVALHVGGERWFGMAVQSFRDLNSTADASEVLSADQQTLKELCDFIAEYGYERKDFIPGLEMADELCLLSRFEGRTALSVTHDIARAMPVKAIKKRPNGNDAPAWGYYAAWVMDAWEAQRPVATALSVSFVERGAWGE
jgi:hypothetical protein